MKNNFEDWKGILGFVFILGSVVFAISVWSYKSNIPSAIKDTTPASSATSINETQQQIQPNQAGTQTNPSPITPSSSQTESKSLSEIVKEWRKSTAYVLCFWDYSNGTQYQTLSGSGLLATVNSIPTIITNKHVAVDSFYGAANECDIRFPDDNGYYFYSKNNPNPSGGLFSDNGTLTIASNGNDVAYISNIDSTWQSLSFETYPQPSPAISLDNRDRNDAYSCKNTLNTGDPILILGYPSYGTQMGSVLSSPAEPTATEGIISGKDGIYYTTSAKIDHGNSGGLAIDQTNNCYFGIPTWDKAGSFESLGRILPSSFFLSYQ